MKTLEESHEDAIGQYDNLIKFQTERIDEAQKFASKLQEAGDPKNEIESRISNMVMEKADIINKKAHVDVMYRMNNPIDVEKINGQLLEIHQAVADMSRMTRQLVNMEKTRALT